MTNTNKNSSSSNNNNRTKEERFLYCFGLNQINMGFVHPDKVLSQELPDLWQYDLQPAGWIKCTSKLHDWCFIPSSLAFLQSRIVKKHGTRNIHYAEGWEGLRDMQDKVGDLMKYFPKPTEEMLTVAETKGKLPAGDEIRTAATAVPITNNEMAVGDESEPAVVKGVAKEEASEAVAASALIEMDVPKCLPHGDTETSGAPSFSLQKQHNENGNIISVRDGDEQEENSVTTSSTTGSPLPSSLPSSSFGHCSSASTSTKGNTRKSSRNRKAPFRFADSVLAAAPSSARSTENNAQVVGSSLKNKKSTTVVYLSSSDCSETNTTATESNAATNAATATDTTTNNNNNTDNQESVAIDANHHQLVMKHLHKIECTLYGHELTPSNFDNDNNDCKSPSRKRGRNNKIGTPNKSSRMNKKQHCLNGTISYNDSSTTNNNRRQLQQPKRRRGGLISRIKRLESIFLRDSMKHVKEHRTPLERVEILEEMILNSTQYDLGGLLDRVEYLEELC